MTTVMAIALCGLLYLGLEVSGHDAERTEEGA